MKIISDNIKRDCDKSYKDLSLNKWAIDWYVGIFSYPSIIRRFDLLNSNNQIK